MNLALFSITHQAPPFCSGGSIVCIYQSRVVPASSSKWSNILTLQSNIHHCLPSRRSLKHGTLGQGAEGHSLSFFSISRILKDRPLPCHYWLWHFLLSVSGSNPPSFWVYSFLPSVETDHSWTDHHTPLLPWRRYGNSLTRKSEGLISLFWET